MLRSLKCLHCLALCAFAFASLASAQSQRPAAPPSSSQQPSQSGVATLRAGTQLVVVDVVVLDKNHKPVHGLKASDFTLAEDTVPQTLKNFEEHSALTLAEAMKFPELPKLPPGVFTNYTPAPVNGAVDVLLIDALNTPLIDQLYLRQQLLAYINSIPPGNRIAIFGLTSRLSVLQGFTSDPAVLKTVASSTKFARNSPVLKDSTGGSGIQNSLGDEAEDAGLQSDTVANVRLFDAEVESFQTQLRIKFTLDALSQLARYLAAIPGRKNLIWFSGAFPISIFPDPSLSAPFAASAVEADSEDQFRYTVNQLARAQVAVYPVDPRGLSTSSAFDAATTHNYAGNPTRMTQDLSKFSNDTAMEHSTMSQMAEGTGGRAFYNTNDLTKTVTAAVEEGSNFYTLAYTSANPNRNGEFRKIKIQLARQGLNLTYRQGYYADNPNKANPSTNRIPSKQVPDSAVTAAAPSVQQSIRGAMMRGSPTPSEILIKVGVFPTGPVTQTQDQPAPGNIPSEKTHGPYRRYSISYAISPNDITFLRKPDGKIHANFELVIFVYNPDGTLVNRLSTPLHIASTMDQIVKNVAQGIHYSQEVSAPAKGEYFFRIAVHDLQRDRFGVVEVATSEVKNLQPPTTPPAPPAPVNSPAAAPASTSVSPTESPTVPK